MERLSCCQVVKLKSKIKNQGQDQNRNQDQDQDQNHNQNQSQDQDALQGRSAADSGSESVRFGGNEPHVPADLFI